MIARRIATVVATLLAAGLGACGSPAVAERRSTEPAAVVPAAGTRVAQRDVQAAARAETTVRNVPSAFRLPPGSHLTTLTDAESGASFTLAAPGPEAVLSFYRRELSRGAFTIVADRVEPGATSLSFRDADGWAGTIYATTHRVAVAVKRS
ncbi:hypothetical protein [Actinoplanes sp. M2I2]|uniref:hypothetical protein n=1 Tax=Actinoplanes sp. M2I2 TaxID=1734444 RepID=UPI002020E90C|nr:hypothetical protein [Actinoplanes sp. M2I2]